MKKFLIILIILMCYNIGNCGLIGMFQRSEINNNIQKLTKLLEQQSSQMYPPCFATLKCNRSQKSISVNTSKILDFQVETTALNYWVRIKIVGSERITCIVHDRENLNNFLEEVKQCEEKYLK